MILAQCGQLFIGKCLPLYALTVKSNFVRCIWHHVSNPAGAGGSWKALKGTVDNSPPSKLAAFCWSSLQMCCNTLFFHWFLMLIKADRMSAKRCWSAAASIKTEGDVVEWHKLGSKRSQKSIGGDRQTDEERRSNSLKSQQSVSSY